MQEIKFNEINNLQEWVPADFAASQHHQTVLMDVYFCA